MLKLKLISLIIIAIGLMFLFCIYYKKDVDMISTKKEIELINTKMESNDDIVGYIEIPRFNINRIVKNNSNTTTLDDNYVGMFYFFNSLDSDSAIALAGHNIDNVFKCLHKLDVGDEVILHSGNKIYNYYVVRKEIIRTNDFSIFVDLPNTMYLMTCTHNQNTRLVVVLNRENT